MENKQKYSKCPSLCWLYFYLFLKTTTVNILLHATVSAMDCTPNVVNKRCFFFFLYLSIPGLRKGPGKSWKSPGFFRWKSLNPVQNISYHGQNTLLAAGGSENQTSFRVHTLSCGSVTFSVFDPSYDVLRDVITIELQWLLRAALCRNCASASTCESHVTSRHWPSPLTSVWPSNLTVHGSSLKSLFTRLQLSDLSR